MSEKKPSSRSLWVPVLSQTHICLWSCPLTSASEPEGD